MSKFKFGMRVWSPSNGWGIVDAILPAVNEYPISVRFDDGECDEYTNDGKFSINDVKPLLFLDEVKEWPDPPAPLPQLAIDTPVWGSPWPNSDMWGYHFARWKDGAMLAWPSGLTSHSNRGAGPITLVRWSLTNPNIVSTETEGITE